MRLLQHLNERRTKYVGKEDAIKVIRAKCKKHVKAITSGNRPHIYRGIQGYHENYGIVDIGSEDDRRSKNTTNHMTLLMDNLPSWKSYPKRSQSIICSTNSSNASSYGSLYMVYPTDQCNIGVCPASDIWDGFFKAFGGYRIDVPAWNNYLKTHSIPDTGWAAMKGAMIKFYEISLTDMFNQMKRTYENSKEKKWEDERDKIIRTLASSLSSANGQKGSQIPFVFEYIVESLLEVDKGKRPLPVIDMLNKELSPEVNKFYLNNDRKMYGDKEVWIGNGYMVLVKSHYSVQETMEKEGLF